MFFEAAINRRRSTTETKQATIYETDDDHEKFIEQFKKKQKENNKQTHAYSLT
jgi:hypothetical protein